MESTVSARFIGGPYGGQRATLTHAPLRVDLDGEMYERIDDPDTGEYLGGYAHCPPSPCDA